MHNVSTTIATANKLNQVRNEHPICPLKSCRLSYEGKPTQLEATRPYVTTFI